MKNKFLSKSVPRGTRTIWRYLGALFLIFTLSIGQMWAANVPAAAGTYSVVGKKPGNANRFYKLGNGVYIHRVNNSSWDSSMGMKIPSDNQNGVAVYLSSSMKVSALINKKSDKNAVNVELKAYPITNGPTTFDAFEAGTDNSTEITVTCSSTASYTLSTSFAKLDSKAAENKSTNEVTFAAGYYYIVGTDDLGTTYLTSITLTAASSDPVDPTITFNNGAYTVGATALDLSTLFTSNSTGAVTYTVKTDGGTSASISGTSFSATAAGTCVVTASQAAVTGTYNAKAVDANIVVSAPVAVTGITITPALPEVTVGNTVALSAAISPDNASDKTVTWSVQSGATYAEVSSTGVVTGLAEGSATIRATANDGSGVYADKVVTVAAALPPCFTFVPDAKSESVTVEGSSITTCTGGTMVWSKGGSNSSTLAYDATYGLLFGGSGSCNVIVTLNHLMQENTEITVTIVADPKDDSNRGLLLRDGTSSTNRATWTWKPAANKDEKVFTYKVKSGDGLIGTNVFRIFRSTNAYIKSLSVSNCGAELLALSSAVSVAGKATVTLSKSLVAAGGTATASYSDLDSEYEFDGWEITSGDATIADASAATAAITMGTTASTITLKLKEAGVKYDVHFDSKGGSAVDDQLVEKNGHASVPTAPTKFKYTFGGWSETDGGSTPADLSTIAITAEKTFYAIWTPKVCPTSGEIYSLVADPTKAPGSNTYYPTTKPGVADLAIYATVSGGLAQSIQTTSSNNSVQIQSSTAAMKITADNSIVRALLECPLQEGDTIKLVKDNKLKITFDSVATSAKTIQLASGEGENKDYYVVEAKFAGMDTIHVRKNGSNVSLTSLKVIRPAKYAVTFNMQGHGDQVAQQDILEGGKVSEPATTNITGWDFGGWFTNAACSEGKEWAFATATVSQDTVLYAKWTEHVLSNNVALGTLTVNGEDVAIVPSQLGYAVELPFGTTAIPTVAATAADANAKACNVTQASAVDGSATIYVKAEDNTTEATYTINFSVATSKGIQLVFKTGTTPCVGSASTSTQILSNNAAVSTYINQIAFTNVEGAGDNGAEGGSLNVGKKAGNMFTLSAKAGYAFQAMNFLAKIQDATCEYSIDGGAWTELASTNTGADECYAPFTSGTVHEFRLRSTGAEGVWIRNMQLTIIEACTPITIAWDEEPVEFEVGKSGYAIAATADNAGEVAYSSTDGDVIAVNGSTGALTVSALGSVTLKAATAEGDGTIYCANGGNNIEISKAVNTYYLVKFDAQNGDAADEVKYFSGDAAIALPATDPTFAGYDFQGWFDAETGGNEITSAITPTASMTVYAQWVAQCAGATITTQPVDASYLTGRTPAALVCEATAGNGGALTYEWFTCDDALKTNPVAATAMPSTAVAGTFYYFCKVMEEGCDVEAYSDVVTITVADKDAICLVKAELAPGSSAASITSTSGYYKDDENIAINIKKDLKLGSKGNYVKVAIDGANFQDGDVVEITLASDKTASAWLQIFTDEGTTMVAEMTSGVSREHPNYLTISGVPANTKTLYLYRTEAADGNMNPYPTSMAVYRTCAPILNKVTVAGVNGTPDNTNHIAIEVPFSTLDAALDAIAYDWVSNDAAWTAAHNPAVANAWEWGVENTVTLTDKDNDQSVYYVTISKAAASSDATLSALTVNGQAIALADGVFEYSFELPYGTTSVPTVVATANHIAAVATVDPCTLSGATITVVPESGAGDQKVYTLTFTISAWKDVAIWDGSTMSAVATSPDATGLAWATTGFGSIANYNTTCGEKSYTKVLPSGGAATGRYMTITVPKDYVAKFYVVMASHSDGSERGMFIGSNLVKDPDATSILELSNSDRDVAVAGMSEIVGEGTYYINPNASIDFQEIRAYVRKGYARTSMLGNGVYGTVCVPNNVAIEDIQGVTVYELMGREPEYGKLAFDEIISGELEAGVPYVFQAHGDKMILFYGETSVADPVDKGNGMYGTFTDQTLTELDDVYYFAQRALWSCSDLTSLSLPANRAYVKLSVVGNLSDPNPAPGRRRVTMNVNGEKVATGMDNLNASEQPIKVMIDGQLFIICGEKMFDATGRLVK